MKAGSQLTNKWARLRSMSWPEFEDRTRQNLTARLDAHRTRRGYDFADPSISANMRTGNFFFRALDIPALVTTLRRIMPRHTEEIVARAQAICNHQFDLLGYTGIDYGAEIDWHLDAVHGKRAPVKPWFQVGYLDFDEVGDAKVTWELNRHQHLVTLAKAYHITGDAAFARECIAQWQNWQQQNRYPMGVNWASSLEVAFRTLSWIWVFFLLDGSAEFSPELRRDWIRALSISGRHIDTYLSTYFSPNTHLLGEALALFFLGTLFPHLRSAARWRHRGWETILREERTQVRDDGFYFEQSTYYHVYALDMLLHARILAGANERAIPESFDRRIVQMLDALLLLCRAGAPPAIGDDDGGRLFDPRRNRPEHLFDPLSTGAALFARGDYKFMAGYLREETLWLLGIPGMDRFDSTETAAPPTHSVALEPSGLYLMADAELGHQLFIDAGPQGPNTAGHGHADALSICLAGAGRTVLGDSGTFEYVGPSGERSRLRGTGAHNTVAIDGRDQAESTGPFSWTNLPRVSVESWLMGETFNYFRASHDAYSRLAPGLRHRRWVFHQKGRFWLVRDAVEGSGSHLVSVTWNIGSSLTPAPGRDLRFGDIEGQLLLALPEGHGWMQSIERDVWAPAYGHQERRSCVRFESKRELPTEFVTLIASSTALPRDPVRIVPLRASSDETAGYSVRWNHDEHLCLFARGTPPWTCAGWSSDAEFVAVHRSRSDDRLTLVLVNGSFVEFAGQRLVSSERPVRYAEVSSGAGKTEIYSSNPSAVLVDRNFERTLVELETTSHSKG
jgi:hypothetical protein